MIFGKKKPKEKKDTGWIAAFMWIPRPLFDGGYVWLQPALKRTITDCFFETDVVVCCLESTKAQADEYVKEMLLTFEEDCE